MFKALWFRTVLIFALVSVAAAAYGAKAKMTPWPLLALRRERTGHRRRARGAAVGRAADEPSRPEGRDRGDIPRAGRAQEGVLRPRRRLRRYERIRPGGGNITRHGRGKPRSRGSLA